MTSGNQNVWQYIFGGAFIGFWLFIILAPQEVGLDQGEAGEWALWGVFGLVLAGAFYAGRLANEALRIGIWVTTGILLGALVAAAILGGQGAFLATLLSGTGALLIAAALPGNRSGTQQGSPPAYAPAPPPPSPPGPPGHDDAWERHTQTQGGQQQSVVIQRTR